MKNVLVMLFLATVGCKLSPDKLSSVEPSPVEVPQPPKPATPHKRVFAEIDPCGQSCCVLNISCVEKKELFACVEG